MLPLVLLARTLLALALAVIALAGRANAVDYVATIAGKIFDDGAEHWSVFQGPYFPVTLAHTDRLVFRGSYGAHTAYVLQTDSCNASLPGTALTLSTCRDGASTCAYFDGAQWADGIYYVICTVEGHCANANMKVKIYVGNATDSTGAASHVTTSTSTGTVIAVAAAVVLGMGTAMEPAL